MRAFSFIPALAALVTAVTSAAILADNNNGPELAGCGLARSATEENYPARNTRDLTNAERLPIKSPILRRGGFVRRLHIALVPLKELPIVLGTPVHRTSPSASPPPNPKPNQPSTGLGSNTISHRGMMIQITDAANGTVLG